MRTSGFGLRARHSILEQDIPLATYTASGATLFGGPIFATFSHEKMWRRSFCYCQLKYERRVLQYRIQIQRKLNRKRKQKRNRGSDLRGGASRPSRRFPCLRFCFRFRFNFRLILIFKKNCKSELSMYILNFLCILFAFWTCRFLCLQMSCYSPYAPRRVDVLRGGDL